MDKNFRFAIEIVITFVSYGDVYGFGLHSHIAFSKLSFVFKLAYFILNCHIDCPMITVGNKQVRQLFKQKSQLGLETYGTLSVTDVHIGSFKKSN